MIKKIKRFVLEPHPLRTILEEVLKKYEFGSYLQRLELGAVERPHYGYCVFSAANLAKKLNYKKISILEFGVAGGNGLLNLEYHVKEVEKLFDIEIDIYGFDTGVGLPEPKDYRDLPYHWKKGFFNMDVSKLESRLSKAKLVLGDIKKTSLEFFEKYNPAPIGAIAYDFDFYSSTVTALEMLKANESYYLPRVFCYFDDTIGTEVELYNDFTGERLAINEFNNMNSNIKLSFPYHLLKKKLIKTWYYQIWICHFFKHSRYNDFISKEDQQRALSEK